MSGKFVSGFQTVFDKMAAICPDLSCCCCGLALVSVNLTPVAPGKSYVRKVAHLLSGAYSIIQMVFIYKLILNLLFTSHGTIAYISMAIL